MRAVFLMMASTVVLVVPTQASDGTQAVLQAAEASPSEAASRRDLTAGAELFSREWVPGDPRSVRGDGPGPEANATSCVACHSQGGVGGAGGRARNVSTGSDLADVFGGMQATMVPVMVGRQGAASLGTARNPPALFGAGRIDAIPEADIRALAAEPDPDHPEITGRVSETDDGRVGRFAWKGHVPSLADFVAQACEVELGLTVEDPDRPGRTRKADLSAPQVDQLTAFVAALPAPDELEGQPFAPRGEQVFTEVGCASCHTPSVGPAERIFSDLLLHDMGPGLSDAGFGYADVAPSELVAVAQEWRTPPLWGLRDSAPYLHDGRADTIEAAIQHHGGEATKVVEAWRALSTEDRVALDSFLRSLSAPHAASPPGRGPLRPPR